MCRPQLKVVRHAFPDRAALGTAVSRAILLRVAAGELPATMRLHRPGRILAFSRQDRAAAGFESAVRAARRHGFQATIRLVGGRAAVYHEGTLAISLAVPDRRPVERTQARFTQLAEAISAALRSLGVDARVGEVPGEYCPGGFSVNARGQAKLAGIGQRIISGGAHVGGVLVVSDSAAVRSVLEPVYEALGLDWDPATAGSVEDELGKADEEAVAAALLEELARRWELVPAEFDADTLALAGQLESDHLALDRGSDFG